MFDIKITFSLIKISKLTIELFIIYYNSFRVVMSIKWNFEDLYLREIDILIITILNEYKEEIKNISIIQLQILTHLMCIKGNYATFKEKIPIYLNIKSDESCIIVFDLHGKSSDFNIPKWANVEKILWNEKFHMFREIMLDIQSAFNLVLYYQNIHLNPIYFLSYLIFTKSNSFLDDVLFQIIPVFKNGKIFFRYCCVDKLNLLFNFILSDSDIGSFVLVPPHDRCFKVSDVEGNKITLVGFNKKVLYCDINKINIIKIASTSNILLNFFAYECFFEESFIECFQNSFIKNIKEKTFFSFVGTDTGDFFHEGTSPTRTENKCFVDFNEISTEHMLNELEESEEIVDSLKKTFGKINLFPYMHKNVLFNYKQCFSIFNIGFSLGKTRAPVFVDKLINYKSVEYVSLYVPSVIIKNNGKDLDVSANQVMDRWLDDSYSPYNGPKNVYYVVLINENADISKSLVEFFMLDVSDRFSSYGFGNLNPSYMVNPFAIISLYKKPDIDSLIPQNHIAFMIGDLYSNLNNNNNLKRIFLSETTIKKYSMSDVCLIAFIAYSIVPSSVYLSDSYRVDKLFLSLLKNSNYSPPFILSSSDNETVHIVWCNKNNFLSVIDSVGSFLITIVIDSLDEILNIVNAVKLSLKITNVTFTLIGDPMTRKLLNDIKNILLKVNSIRFSIFYLIVTSYIQLINSATPNDIVVFSDVEIPFERPNDFEDPLESCFVISMKLNAYQACVYFSQDEPKEVLLKYIKDMSDLSWLSVNPYFKDRMYSLPPHILPSFFYEDCDIDSLYRIEWLPSMISL